MVEDDMPDGGGESRRERILWAAIREFANHGFAGARVERIAAAARVNKQLLFHYFGSKVGLHRATLETILGRFPREAVKGGLPAERLRDLVTGIVAAVVAYPALLGQLESSHTGGDSVMLDEWKQAMRREVRNILLDGQRVGYLRDDIDVDSISEVIVGACLGYVAAGDHGNAGRADEYVSTLLRMAVDHSIWR